MWKGRRPRQSLLRHLLDSYESEEMESAQQRESVPGRAAHWPPLDAPSPTPGMGRQPLPGQLKRLDAIKRPSVVMATSLADRVRRVGPREARFAEQRVT